MFRLAFQAVLLGLGLGVLTANADDRPIIVNVNFAQPYMPPNVPPFAPTATEIGMGAAQIPNLPPPSALNRFNLACYTNRNSPQCTNLRNELRFIFGTCRDFFGEPCLPHPNATGRGVTGMRGSSIFGNGSGSTIFGGTSGCCR